MKVNFDDIEIANIDAGGGAPARARILSRS